MLTQRGRAHIRSSRNIKGFRSCAHSTGGCAAHLDVARIAREGTRLAAREARRLWLIEQWQQHFNRVAGPSRALPPSARPRQAGSR